MELVVVDLCCPVAITPVLSPLGRAAVRGLCPSSVSSVVVWVSVPDLTVFPMAYVMFALLSAVPLVPGRSKPIVTRIAPEGQTMLGITVPGQIPSLVKERRWETR